jgi:hypothetical protein
MNLRKNMAGKAMLIGILGLAIAGCQKMEKPELGNYPQDTNPPGGPLRFYTAFDGTEVDSIRATFGDPENASYTTGITKQAYKGSSSSYIVYPSANDFSKSTSMTIAFWMKKLPHAANAEFVFALPTTTDIWHKSEMFLLIEDQNQTTTSQAAMKLMIQDQWIEFVGTQRLANVTNGEWHHLAFVYDEATSKLTTYVDGTALTGLPANLTDIKNGGAPRGALSFKNVSKFVVGGPSHHALGATPDGWMANYSGELDQFRLYNKALTAAEIQALYNSKL